MLLLQLLATQDHNQEDVIINKSMLKEVCFELWSLKLILIRKQLDFSDLEENLDSIVKIILLLIENQVIIQN